MPRSELQDFMSYVDSLSVQPAAQPTENVRPVILNPFFWFACATQVLLLCGTQTAGRQFELIWLATVFVNLASIISALAYDKIIVHIYRLTVTPLGNANISPLRAAQLKTVGQNVPRS